MLFRCIRRIFAPTFAVIAVTSCVGSSALSSTTASSSSLAGARPVAAVSATVVARPPMAPPPAATVADPASATSTTGPIANHFTLTILDSGQTFTYSITERMAVVLNGDSYPRSELKVACVPSNTLGSISNLPSVSPPDYAVRYDGVTPGTCTITDRDFSVRLRIAAPTPAAMVTPVTGQVSPPGTTIGGLPRYLDDRSTPEEVIRSLFNAINRKEYDRAYSYWEPGVATTQLPPYDQFKAGYANTVSATLTLGKTTSDVGAGQLYFSVPTTLVAQLTNGHTQTFVGCYKLHLAQPSIQDLPPFQPISIMSASVKQVPNSADTTTLMGQACH